MQHITSVHAVHLAKQPLPFVCEATFCRNLMMTLQIGSIEHRKMSLKEVEEEVVKVGLAGGGDHEECVSHSRRRPLTQSFASCILFLREKNLVRKAVHL